MRFVFTFLWFQHFLLLLKWRLQDNGLEKRIWILIIMAYGFRLSLLNAFAEKPLTSCLRQPFEYQFLSFWLSLKWRLRLHKRSGYLNAEICIVWYSTMANHWFPWNFTLMPSDWCKYLLHIAAKMWQFS